MSVLESGFEVIRKRVDCGHIPGAAFAFVTPGGSEFGFYGSRQLVPERLPLEEDTLFDLASLSKVVVTTTLCLKLIEDGKLELSTALSDILPDFPHREVTIQHILTHTSGIDADDKEYKKCRGEQELWDFIKAKSLCFSPGSMVEYSDCAYIALGRAIGAITGGLEEFAVKAIFEPLGMSDTMYAPSAKGLADRCAPTEVTAERGVIKGEVHDGKAWRMGGVSGNAGVFSTLRDVERFTRMMLCGGSLGQVQVLKEESVELLKHCYTEGLNLRRTLGWFCNDPTASIGTHYSEHCIYHTGFTGTSIYIDFDRGCGAVLLSNRVHPSREHSVMQDVRNEFHDALLTEFDKQNNL